MSLESPSATLTAFGALLITLPMFSQSADLPKRAKPVLRMQLERYRNSHELPVLLYGDPLCNTAIYAVHQIFSAPEGQECELEDGRINDIWPKTQAKISSVGTFDILLVCAYVESHR